MMHGRFYLITILAVLFVRSAQAQDLILPRPMGGNEALASLLDAELSYPALSLEKKVKGKVILGFDVSVKGNTSNVRIRESPADELSEEALRVFRLIRWEPALYQGQAIAHSHSLSIVFNPGMHRRLVRSRGYAEPPCSFLPMDTSLFIFPQNQVDVAPSPVYPGNCNNIREFISRNLSYPPSAIKPGITGTVEIGLTIEPSGRSSNVYIIRGIGGGCDEEAQRLASMLRWVPARKSERYVRSEMRISIIFALPEGSDYRYFPTHQGTSVQ